MKASMFDSGATFAANLKKRNAETQHTSSALCAAMEKVE